MDQWVVPNQIDKFEVCFRKNITQRSLWRGENIMITSLPTFVLQLFCIILIIHIITFVLKPFRQPRIVAEILGGVLLGGSGVGATQFFLTYVFPFKSIAILETVASLSVVYYMFLVGLETDISLILRAGKKAYSVALTGILFALAIGYGLFHYLRPKHSIPVAGGDLFLAIVIACTNFQEVARILAKVKLLRSEVGRTALTSSLISDLACWGFLVLAQAILEKGSHVAVPSTIIFMMFLVFAVRPALKWIILHISKEDSYNNEFHVCCVLTGVILCGFIADACGAHSFAGAFMLGVIMPKGNLKDTLMERVEDFASRFMMPLFFILIGLRTNLRDISLGQTLLVIAISAAPKILSTFLVSLFFSISALDALALGLLMTTKGLFSFIVLSSGRTRKALDSQMYAMMVVALWFMTLVIGPILTCTYKRTRRWRQYKSRTIQSTKQDNGFLILVCIHSVRHVPGIITLLRASMTNELSPVCIFAVHLVELAGRASSMLIVHDTYDKSSKKGSTSTARTRATHPESILGAFERLESQGNGVTVHPLTAMSAYDSMHEDICSLADDKRVILILIPFHKQPTIDGGLENSNPTMRGVNQQVLANAPCSVGIFVDRGLCTSMKRKESKQGNIGQRFAMLFIGGRDDREALAYAWRLSGHPIVSLDVVRFVPGDRDHLINPIDHNHQGDHDDDKEEILVTTLKDRLDSDREKQLDDEYIAKFRQSSNGNPSITYMEKVENNGEETIKTISNLEHEYDLYIVGRREGMVSSLTSGLTEWSEYPELGALGNTLVSSNFSSNVSVLIVQQHIGSGGGGVENAKPEHIGHLKEEFGHMTWQPPPKDNADKKAFVHHAGGDYDDHDAF